MEFTWEQDRRQGQWGGGGKWEIGEPVAFHSICLSVVNCQRTAISCNRWKRAVSRQRAGSLYAHREIVYAHQGERKSYRYRHQEGVYVRLSFYSKTITGVYLEEVSCFGFGILAAYRKIYLWIADILSRWTRSSGYRGAGSLRERTSARLCLALSAYYHHRFVLSIGQHGSPLLQETCMSEIAEAYIHNNTDILNRKDGYLMIIFSFIDYILLHNYNKV